MRFDRCPFCVSGEIVVDTDAVRSWEPPATKIGEVVINHTPDQPIVRFLPHPELLRPCPHLIYALVDVDCGTGPRCERSVTLSWLHPWLLEGVSQFSRFYDMWECVVEPSDRTCIPTVPHRIRRPSPDFSSPG